MAGLLFFLITLIPLPPELPAGTAKEAVLHRAGWVRAAGVGIRYAGWAVEAYPELSVARMQAMVRRIANAGANVIWIGHNNPGEVQPDKVEPGLSYAVYEATRNPTDPRHQVAVAIVEAQHRMLEACRTVGVKAVLPVGYQIQMGRVWNDAHPGDLRRDAEGQPLDIYGGGLSASFYAPSYRQDIAAYYRWVEAEFVRPYAGVLLMLNLADEPIGGDYSAHAEAEFRRRTGLDFADVGDDPEHQRLLGAFQSGYVVEYAAFSAQMWQQIHPGLPVTLSFDGAQARATFAMPDVESLFRDTPGNLVITFDAYPHDGLPRVPARDEDLVRLFLLARSVGLYSARYARPVWMWAASNSWGLSQASPDPGTISDAVANGLYLALLVRQGGGDLQGIAYWNYNVKEQGLYNDTHATAYHPDAMFARVSATLPTLRGLMAQAPGRPDVLVLAPPAVAHQAIGAAREAVRMEAQPFQKLAVLARMGVNAAIVDGLEGWELLARPALRSTASLAVAAGGGPGEQMRAIVVLAPAAGFLSPSDLAILRGFLAKGGRVVAAPEVGAVLRGTEAETAQQTFGGLVDRRGTLYVAQKGVAVLFEDKQHEILLPFWREVLGLVALPAGYRVVTEGVAFSYNLGPEPAVVSIAFPLEGVGYRYDDQARAAEWIDAPFTITKLRRREYVLLWRARWPGPRNFMTDLR